MAKYIDKLPKQKEQFLLKEFRIKPEENSIPEISSYGGKLFVVYGENKDGDRVESVFLDYTIEKIYGGKPSEYDIDRFQNIMTYLCGPQYNKDANAFNKQFRPNHIKDFNENAFEEEEYEEE